MYSIWGWLRSYIYSAPIARSTALYCPVFQIFQNRKMFQNHAFSSVLRFSKTPCFSKTFPVAHPTQDTCKNTV